MVNSVQEIKEKILPIFEKRGVLKAGLFGSYVRNAQRKNSDVDILVELDDCLSLLDVSSIKIELEEALDKEVDLVEYDTIKPELKESILNEEVLIYEKR
jgi:predicted nucleotidyltransferase